MFGFVALFARFVRVIAHGWKQPEFRGLALTSITIIGTGTWFFSWAERWSVLDSLYFSVITLTTVGYGDLVPTRPISKTLVIVFIVMGLGLLLAFVDVMTRAASEIKRAR